MVRGLNSGGGEIFRAIQTGPKAACKNGLRFFPRGLAARVGAVPPPPSAGLQMGWSYTSAFLLCLHRHVMVYLYHYSSHMM